MKILAFDTTNSTLSVAILFDKKLVAKKDIFENNRQAEMLVPAIEECLTKLAMWYQDLDLIAFTKGPGSFTGVRIGCSCAKALAIATKLPVIAFSSLEVIAYNYYSRVVNNNDYQKILVVNDAKLDEFFIQEFVIEGNKIKSTFKPTLINSKEIKKFLPQQQFLLAGSAKLMIKDEIKNAIVFEQEDFINAKNIALLALEKYAISNPRELSALYIRQPKITARKNQEAKN
jgi:tRNA threonylcarbamoyladenosine biosynthesis protein TsaB